MKINKNTILYITIIIFLIGSNVDILSLRPQQIIWPAVFFIIFLNTKEIPFKITIPTFLFFTLSILQFTYISNIDRYYSYLYYMLMAITSLLLGAICKNTHYLNVSLIIITLVSLFILLLQILNLDLSFILSPSQEYASSYGNINDYAAFLFLFGIMLWIIDSRFWFLIFIAGFLYALLLERRLITIAYILFSILNFINFRYSRKKIFLLVILFLLILTSLIVLIHTNVIHLREISFNTDSITSSSARLIMLQDVIHQISSQNIVYHVLGNGIGQLNIIWPYDGSNWASLHFFLFEFYYYWGISFLLLYFIILSKNIKIFLPVTLAMLSMSSIMYFLPFYFFLGVYFRTPPIKNKQPD